jgi:hypothetical protein
MAKLTQPTTLEALEAFLSDHPPTGASVVRAALALRLAAALETAPDYGLGRLASALASLLDELEDEMKLAADARENLSWLKQAS